MSDYDVSAAQAHFAARLAFTTGVHELDYLIQQQPGQVSVIDVRFPKDYAAGHVPGAINLPRGKWTHPRGLRKDATHYVYCYDQTCHLAVEAAVELTRQGYRVVEVEGGFERWQEKGYRSEPAAAAA
jgi:rhodanese-related sulfurtransferase